MALGKVHGSQDGLPLDLGHRPRIPLGRLPAFRPRRRCAVLCRQLIEEDLLAAGEEYERLDEVAELAHVPGPELPLEGGQHRRLDAPHIPVQLLVEELQEVLDEEWNVLRPFAQRRNLQSHHLETVVEVLAKSPVRHPAREVAVGGCHQAKIHRELGCTANAHDVALLEHPQEFHLQVRRQLGYLVQEKGAAGGPLDEPNAALVGAGESPFLMAEELRLEDLAGNGAAVDRDERPSGPRRVLVQGVGDELLPGPRLTDYQDCGPGGRGDSQTLEQILHGRGMTDDSLEAEALLQTLAEAAVLVR